MREKVLEPTVLADTYLASCQCCLLLGSGHLEHDRVLWSRARARLASLHCTKHQRHVRHMPIFTGQSSSSLSVDANYVRGMQAFVHKGRIGGATANACIHTSNTFLPAPTECSNITNISNHRQKLQTQGPNNMSNKETSTLQSYIDKAGAAVQDVIGSVTGNQADKVSD